MQPDLTGAQNDAARVIRLAVVICTYNRSASLLETLRSLYDDGYSGPAPIDIVVVANNCADDTLARLAAFRAAHPQTLLRLSWLEEARPGKSYALNTAIEHTDHDVLCFIDDDQVVEPGFLRQLMEGIDAYPEDDIFCGRIWPAWDGKEPSWVHAREPYKIPIRPFPEFNLGTAPLRLGYSDRFPSGGNISVRRRVFDRIGGFALDLGPTGHNLAGGEDHDFLRRAKLGGHTIRYLPKVSQLHAIDAERMSTVYTLKKSYFRSRANFLIHTPSRMPRLYMLRKIFNHFFSAIFSMDRNRRFFYLTRTAASLGELAGSIELLRDKMNKRRSNPPLPLGFHGGMIALLAVTCLTSGAVAWLFAGAEKWNGLMAAAAVAYVGAFGLLFKSIRDFSQTGPRIRAEILTHYRRYTLFALARLGLWAFLLMTLAAGAGVFVYHELQMIFDWTWSPWLALFAALLGLTAITLFRFVYLLRFNPGLLVASMHYRTSRLYPLWQWATPARLRALRDLTGIAILALLLAASWKLWGRDAKAELISLWSTGLFYATLVIWAEWLPEAPKIKSFRAEDTPPNIILIGSDTLRADRLGALGYRRNLTPNIDALTQKSTLFANCYVPCARTAPSLISLLTGTWPHTHGIRDNFVSDEDTKLAVAALPHLLKPLGYRSAAISDWGGADMGKFALGFDHTDLPEDQWNLKYLIRQGPKDVRLFLSLFTHNRLGRILLPELYYLGNAPLTAQIGPRARALVSRLATAHQPFFLNVFYSTTHPPFASDWPWYTRFADPNYQGESKFAMARLTDPFDIIRRQGAPKEEFDLDHIIDLYDGCVAQFDDEVGRMLQHLQECGLAEHTLLVVYSDHGMEFFEHESWGQGNSAVGDFSARIPLLIHDPRKSGRGVVSHVVRSIDLAPTLLRLAGGSAPESMDGVSFADCFEPERSCPQLDAFNETGIWMTDIPGLPAQHLRYPNLFELLEVPDRESGTLAIKDQYRRITLKAKDRMIRSGRWKLVYQPLVQGHLLRLFDVEADPDCHNDVSASQREITARLWARLEEWMKQDAANALDPDTAGTKGYADSPQEV